MSPGKRPIGIFARPASRTITPITISSPPALISSLPRELTRQFYRRARTRAARGGTRFVAPLPRTVPYSLGLVDRVFPGGTAFVQLLHPNCYTLLFSGDRMRIALSLVIALLTTVAVSQTTPPPSGSTAPESRVLQLKGLDPNLVDKSVDPCVDFYQYSCGGWLKQNPVPADQSSYGRDTELAERNRLILRDILEKAAVNDPKRSPVDQKIGDYYSSCMDEHAIEKKGTGPLKPELDRIAAIEDKKDLAPAIAHLHLINVDELFS